MQIPRLQEGEKRGSQPWCLQRKAWKRAPSAPRRPEKSHHRNPILLPTGWGRCGWFVQPPVALGVWANIPEDSQSISASAAAGAQPKHPFLLHKGWISPSAASCLSFPSSKPPLNSVGDAHRPYIFRHFGFSAGKMQRITYASSLGPHTHP